MIVGSVISDSEGWAMLGLSDKLDEMSKQSEREGTFVL